MMILEDPLSATASPLALSDEQLTLDGYSGPEQDITGTLYKSRTSSADARTPQDFGTIAADGRVTINWPTTVADSELWDGPPGSKIAWLRLSASGGDRLVLKKTGAELFIMYSNNGFTADGVTAVRGWNYMDSEGTVVTDFTGYRWVLVAP